MYPVPTSPPLNLSFVASTSTSVTLFWAPPPTPNQNGVITGYTIQVFSSQQVLLRETNISSNGGTVDSLHPFYNYTCTVVAYTAAGKGPSTPPITVTTLQDGEANNDTSITILHNMFTAQHSTKWTSHKV